MKYQYGSVGAMLAYLDREAIAEYRRKSAKRFFRCIKNQTLRLFCETLKHEMIHNPECHEWNISKKVRYRMKISQAEYYLLRNKAIFLIEKGPNFRKNPSR